MNNEKKIFNSCSYTLILMINNDSLYIIFFMIYFYLNNLKEIQRIKNI